MRATQRRAESCRGGSDWRRSGGKDPTWWEGPERGALEDKNENDEIPLSAWTGDSLIFLQTRRRERIAVTSPGGGAFGGELGNG